MTPRPRPKAVRPKPCPFCGGHANETQRTRGCGDECYYVLSEWAMYCSEADCAAVGPFRASFEDAIRAWNRRPTPRKAKP